MRNTVPRPSSEETSMLPPIWFRLVRTMSMPDATPRDGGDLVLGRQAGHEHQLHGIQRSTGHRRSLG